MKARAIKRKEKDEHCVAELRVSMSNMDTSLTQEIKRRIESTQVVQDHAERKISQMENRLNDLLQLKVDRFQFQLNMLETKVQELNERLQEESINIPRDIEQTGSQLQTMITSFQDEFTAERRDRLTREGRIMKQLTDHAEELTSRWTKEGEERVADTEELKRRLKVHESNRAKADEDFESLIVRELRELRMDLDKEKNERKVEDDEIVEALNRYTENLQKSLSTLE